MYIAQRHCVVRSLLTFLKVFHLNSHLYPFPKKRKQTNKQKQTKQKNKQNNTKHTHIYLSGQTFTSRVDQSGMIFHRLNYPKKYHEI